MKCRAEGRIFLSEKRKKYESSYRRTYHTFGTGGWDGGETNSCNGLYIFSEETLAGGHSFTMTAEKEALLVLVPVIGALKVREQNQESENVIFSGSVYAKIVEQRSLLSFTNPYEDDLIHFIQIWIKSMGSHPETPLLFKNHEPEDFRNNLIRFSLDTTDRYCLSIGRFGGRTEIPYSPLGDDKLLFIHSLQGAFETAGRLLHPKDSIAIWNTGEMEIESLSNDAVLLMLELPRNLKG